MSSSSAPSTDWRANSAGYAHCGRQCLGYEFLYFSTADNVGKDTCPKTGRLVLLRCFVRPIRGQIRDGECRGDETQYPTSDRSARATPSTGGAGARPLPSPC